MCIDGKVGFLIRVIYKDGIEDSMICLMSELRISCQISLTLSVLMAEMQCTKIVRR